MAKGVKAKGDGAKPRKPALTKVSAAKAVTIGDRLPFDRVVALVIGVENYQNPPKRSAISKVHYAEADATAFLQTLEAIYLDEGVEVDGHLYCNSQATLTTLRETATYLIKNLAPTDLFIFYYAGHGFHGEGDNRLTAYDSNPDNLGETTLNLGKEVLEPIKESHGQRALLFVDACAVDLAEAAKGRSVLESLDPREIEDLLDDGDYIGVFLSCSPGEKSYGATTLKHGAYTAHLLQALRGEVPDALQADRWLTDVSLRDWLAVSVKRFVMTNMQVSGQQVPRAILNAPHSFRIRHVSAPKAPPPVTLADLKLKNSDAYLEGVETGPIRTLDGFSTAKKHTVPKVVAASATAWVERLMKDDLSAELDDLRARARSALSLARADTNVEWGDGGGTLDTPHFRFNVICDQDPTDPANYRVRRQLELRDGWEAFSEAIDDLFVRADLTQLVVDIESMPSAYEDIADALDTLAVAGGGTLVEDSAKRLLTYSQSDITLKINLKKGEVQLHFAGCAGLDVIMRARATGLGWREPSPMLPSPPLLPGPLT